MHALPGSMSADEGVPCVQVVPLVHTVGVGPASFGGAPSVLPASVVPGPPSGGGAFVAHEPFGIFAVIQCSSTATSSAPMSPSGGMGFFVDFMRARDTSAIVFLGSSPEGATRSSYVTRWFGAPPVRRAPWQSVHEVASTFATSQGRPSATGAVPSAPGTSPWGVGSVPSVLTPAPRVAALRSPFGPV